MKSDWVTFMDGNEEKEMTIRDFLKMLKKEFKKKGLMDRRIHTTRFDDTELIFIEDPEAKYGHSAFQYGIDRDDKVVVYRS